MNAELARAVWEWLRRHGVREAVVCAGGRNAPLVAAGGDFPSTFAFEERSAAFYALGAAKRLAAPVAVVTTSGTAAAELLPAAVEAFYAGVPLVLVTADRPHRYRGTGAPQAVEQKDLFGPYARTIDVAGPEDLPPEIAIRGPVHLNVAFEDPLRSPSSETSPAVPSLDELARRAARPIVVVGGLAPGERAKARELLLRFGAPAWIETTSGLRGDEALRPLALRSGAERFYRERADGLLRFGAVPTTSLWRETDGALADRPVLTVSDDPWTGCARPGAKNVPWIAVEPVASRWNAGDREEFLFEDARRAAGIEGALDAHPRSEPGLVRWLSRQIASDEGLYLGNSLAIRHWDRFAERRPWTTVDANRGANGIDGQLSTFFGSAPVDRAAWAVVGDLTALYDLSAPWLSAAVAPRRIAIVNNGGGQIFRELFGDERLRNAHDLDFAPWARFWRWEHLRVEAPMPSVAPGPRAVVEIVPDPAETAEVSRILSLEVDVP